MSTATTRILKTAPGNDGAIGASAAAVLQFGEPRMGDGTSPAMCAYM
jgi:hypothetical protein